MKPRARELINLDRLNAEMDKAGLDAVVARAGINFTYLAGFAYPGTLARHVDLADSPRAVYLVWPRHGEPRIVVNAIAAELAQRDSWVERFDLYEGYSERPIMRLADVLKAMGLAEGTVGLEKNYLSAADWEALAGRLPAMRALDATETMDVVRMVKTAAEIERLRTGADLLDDAFLACLPLAKPGLRERELHGALMDYCLSAGCEFVHGILNSSRNTIAYGGESDFVFEAGDAIRTDYVAYMKGYPGHQSRCAVIGKPTAGQKREYAIVRDIYRATNEQLMPGRTAAEVYRFAAEAFAEAGMAYKSILAGHSVGAWWHQQEPIIARDETRPLEAGMVIAMEPHVDHWHIQDMLLVTPDGPQLLSTKFPTDEIFACGV